jgi:hypothetical protein
VAGVVLQALTLTVERRSVMKETRAQEILSSVANSLPTISSLLNVGDDDVKECIDDAINRLTIIKKALDNETMEWD